MSRDFLTPTPGPREQATPLDGLGVWLVSAREERYRDSRELTPDDVLPPAISCGGTAEIVVLRGIANWIRENPDAVPIEIADRVLRLYGER